MTTAILNTNLFEKKISDYANNITTQEFNKLTTENFVARFKES